MAAVAKAKAKSILFFTCFSFIMNRTELISLSESRTIVLPLCNY